MTPEGKVKKEIKKVLDNYRSYGLYVLMPVPTGYGKTSLDFVGFFVGLGFAIEAKAPGKRPTEKQGLKIAEMRAARAKVFIIDGTEDTDTVEDLSRWMNNAVANPVCL